MLTTLKQHVSGFTLALVDQTQDECELISRIKKSSRISPQLALEIYRNNTRGARINALQAIYPACRNILGDDTFRAIAKAYVNADTAGEADLNRYGKAFSRHMHTLLDTGRLPEDYAYLPDLARLEFMTHAAYYADPDPKFDFDLFEQRVLNREQISFQISHSLGLLASSYPVHEIWLHNRPGFNTTQNRHQIQAISGTQYLLVYRDRYIPVVMLVSGHEYQLLEAFADNHTLQNVIEHINCDIDTMLPKLIANKWITGMTAGNR